jgi:acyl-CoA synthetase (AMP-forming)/AMP-acid ligase II
VVVRGYNVMQGYFNDAEATDETVDGEGWLHTGDIGTMDGAGNVSITDRLKDMYVSGGFNVYPAEVEAAFRSHPAVGQVAVIGVPDRRMGEVGLALVVPGPTRVRRTRWWTGPGNAWLTSRCPARCGWWSPFP